MAGVVHAPTRKGLEALSPVQNAMLGMTAGTIEIVVVRVSTMSHRFDPLPPCGPLCMAAIHWPTRISRPFRFTRS